eukprot:5189944-Prorocentrum_lima.AAC.1
MTSSLVGSEMCIRDRLITPQALGWANVSLDIMDILPGIKASLSKLGHGYLQRLVRQVWLAKSAQAGLGQQGAEP